MPAGLVAAVAIVLLALAGIGTRYYVHGDFNLLHGLFSLFFSINLPIGYWEACLFFRRDYVEKRTIYWREWQRETGRTPVREFLSIRVPLRQVLSPTIWADVWATYSQFDASYSDRRTYGFNVDIMNGFVTPLPTLTRGEVYGYILAMNAPWVLCGLLGLYVSIRLILDGNYGVLGY